MYSYFHIVWLLLCIGLSIFAGIYAKKEHDKKIDDRFVLIVGIVLIVTEILKQLMYHVFYYGYLRVDVLPFAFCSIPMFVAVIGALIKKESIKEACYKFLAFYGIVGGAAVMLYPTTLETSFIYISFQTMLWHTSLVVLAVYLIVSRGYGKSWKKEVLPPFAIFLATALVAVGLNELAYHAYLEPLQTPIVKVDDNPGSYQYYKYGFYDAESGEAFYLTYNEQTHSVTLSSSYQDANNIYITYPIENDYGTYAFNIELEDTTKYLEISNEGLIVVDEPTIYWDCESIDGKDVFFSVVDEIKYALEVSSNSIQASPLEGLTKANTISFLEVSVAREGDAANFFFISNHCKTPIPVLDIIQEHVPYPVFVFTYIAGFLGVSSAIWGIAYGITHLPRKKKSE